MPNISDSSSTVPPLKLRCVSSGLSLRSVGIQRSGEGAAHALVLSTAYRLPLSIMQRLLAHLREGARPTSLGADQITHLLSGLRDDLIQRTCYTTAAGGFSVFHPEEELPLEALDPFFLLADYMAEFDMSLRDLGISTTSLSLEHGPRILHQLIVYRILRYKRRYKELASPSFSSSPQGQALEKYLFSAIQRLVDTLNVVHRQDHRVSDALRKVFFKVFDGVPVGIVKGELNQGGVTDFIVFAME